MTGRLTSEKTGTPGFGNTLLIIHANAAQNWAASLVLASENYAHMRDTGLLQSL